MKRRVLAVILALALMTSLIPVPAAFGGDPFDNLNSTAGGLATWDSDLINAEGVEQTGKGVYVAVLDSGLAPDWSEFFPKARVATHLGTGFEQSVTFRASPSDPCELVEVEKGKVRETNWVGSTGSTHGTHVVSTILGYKYYSNVDAVSGYPLPPIVVRGIAPDVTVIPVKVASDYQIPSMPGCPGLQTGRVVFGTGATIAAGIEYATDLAVAGYRPMVINLSVGGSDLSEVEKTALDRAIANGVVVVASAGNDGPEGMSNPGAYAPVISVGSAGWTEEWLSPVGSGYPSPYRLWWLQSEAYDYNDIPEPNPIDQVYVSDFSSRELTGQQLDVLAPGSWARGPYPGTPGFSHLPWHSKGKADLVNGRLGSYYYVGGTSMASPHVAAVAALLLEKNPNLIQSEVETLLKESALPLPESSATVYDPSANEREGGWVEYTWGEDAVGSGLVQADKALEAVGTANAGS